MRLRTQLTLVVTALVALIVALAGLAIVLRIDRQDRSDLDVTLAAHADQARAAATSSGVLPSDGTYAVRLLVDGQVRTQSGSTIPFPVPADDGYATVTADGGDWRSLTETLVSGSRMQVLISLRDLSAAHDDNVLVVDLLVVFAALLTAAGVWFATGLVLRPFQRLLVAARSLDPADPAARLPEVSGPREVAELTGMLNAMLDRFRQYRPPAARFETARPETADTAQLPLVTPPAQGGGGRAGSNGQAAPGGLAGAQAGSSGSGGAHAASGGPAGASAAPGGAHAAPGAQPSSGAPAGAPARHALPSRERLALPAAPAQPEAPAEVAPLPDPGAVLGDPLAGLGANLDTLLDNPDLPATQRHLILAAMAEDHRRMITLLDGMRTGK